jgi:subtilisin family serine protease
MKRLRAALLWLGLACCMPLLPQANAAQAAQTADRQADTASRMVLVMLRMPPPHFRPDSGYGGGYADDGSRAARRRAAGELAAAYGLKLVEDWPMPAIGIDCFVMEDPGSAPLERVLDALGRDPRVAWAQPVNSYRGLGGTRGDPLFPVQPSAQAWRLAELHRASTGRQVTVAVVDSGVDDKQPDLAGQLALRRNFVDAPADAAEHHGTAVAGIVAALEGNGLGIAGVAPQARLMALRACWETARQETRCNSFTLGKALHFALLNGAQIINLSLGGPQDKLLQTLIDAALARGVAVVGAADPERADGGFPASYPGVIAVTSTADRHPMAGALQAPGNDIPATLPGARWGMVSGSSYAAAHVAGLAALVLELHPGSTPLQLRRSFALAPRPMLAAHDPGRVQEQAGSIDACATIARAAGACVCLCPTTAAVSAELLP